MAEFNLGKVVGDKGETGASGADGINGKNGASVWIKYNTLPQDDGAGDVWQDGMDYIGVQTAVADTKPTTGYMWAVFAKGSTPYDGLDSTEVSVPLSANQGRVLNETLVSQVSAEASARANADVQLQENIDTKLNASDVVDNLTSTSATQALSAGQGKVLADKLAKFPFSEPLTQIKANQSAVYIVLGGSVNIYDDEYSNYVTATANSIVTVDYHQYGSIVISKFTVDSYGTPKLTQYATATNANDGSPVIGNGLFLLQNLNATREIDEKEIDKKIL